MSMGNVLRSSGHNNYSDAARAGRTLETASVCADVNTCVRERVQVRVSTRMLMYVHCLHAARPRDKASFQRPVSNQLHVSI